MLWLALDFPALPLEVFTPGDTPFVVLCDNRVAFCNAAAEACGIHLGTTLATTHSIYPGLLHQQQDTQAEATRLKEVAEVLYRFSSYVSVQAPHSIVLEIGGSLRLFGDHAHMAAAAERLCCSLGHVSRARVAQTPWAAVALARSNAQTLRSAPLDMLGLEGTGLEGTGLKGTGLRDTGLNAKALERLHNMGIHTLGPLLDLPIKQLGQRFGTDLQKFLGQLTGVLPDPRQPIAPPQTFEQHHHLLQPITNKADLHQNEHSPMHKLAGELQQWLITHQLGCEALHWQFFSHRQEVVTLTTQFAEARQQRADMLHMARLKLEAQELPSEVLGVGLSTQRLLPWRNQSRPLFALPGGAAGRSQGLDAEANVLQLVDELTARLGDDVCTNVQSLDQHTPEQAWQACPSIAFDTVPVCDRKALPAAPLRPLWLFDSPRPVARAELEILHGPERIQSNWWQATACRDYYIARHRLGAECWAFVDDQAHWYLHGYFG